MPIDPFDGLRVDTKRYVVLRRRPGTCDSGREEFLFRFAACDEMLIKAIIDKATKYYALEQQGTPAVVTPPQVRPEFWVDPGDDE